MKAREFGSWDSKDNSKGGIHNYGDGFNRALKGQPYTRPSEYASSDLDEYHEYPEYKDLTAEAEEEKKNGDNNSGGKDGKDGKSKRLDARNSASKMVRNLVGKFVGVTIGTVVLVNTSPVLAERFPIIKQISSVFTASDVNEEPLPEGGETATPEPGPVILTENWKWSEDFSSVSLELLDEKGVSVEVIPATVVEERTDATCSKEGSVTYKATAEYGEKTYSDTKTEALEPLGHSFDEGTVTVLEDGTIQIDFECERCHEHSIITMSVEEE